MIISRNRRTRARVDRAGNVCPLTKAIARRCADPIDLANFTSFRTPTHRVSYFCHAIPRISRYPGSPETRTDFHRCFSISLFTPRIVPSSRKTTRRMESCERCFLYSYLSPSKTGLLVESRQGKRALTERSSTVGPECFTWAILPIVFRSRVLRLQVYAPVYLQVLSVLAMRALSPVEPPYLPKGDFKQVACRGISCVSCRAAGLSSPE